MQSVAETRTVLHMNGCSNRITASIENVDNVREVKDILCYFRYSEVTVSEYDRGGKNICFLLADLDLIRHAHG